MSVQTGLWHIDDAPFDHALLDRVTAAAAQYGPDGCTRYTNGALGMTYQAFHTNSLSRRERQPYVFTHGHILTWDGRLDNREDLMAQLNLDSLLADNFAATHQEHPHSATTSFTSSTSFTSVPTVDRSAVAPTDVQIVAAAFLRWGTEAFVKLIGDWALALWDNQQKRLLLARDFCGIRHLYYSFLPQQVAQTSACVPVPSHEAVNGNGKAATPPPSCVLWSTNLAAIVTQCHTPLTINDAYIAGFLDRGAEPYLTPYVEVLAVPPGCWVEVAKGASSYASVNSNVPTFPFIPVPFTCKVHVYWRWNENHEIRYETDAEYEEHFRRLFRQAVRRRLRSDAPILAELSGGLDSSSIVCMADDILQEAVLSNKLLAVSKDEAKAGNPSTKDAVPAPSPLISETIGNILAKEIPPSNAEGGASVLSTTPDLITSQQSLTASSNLRTNNSQLTTDGSDLTPRLDTLSYYNTEEPTGDERPYFTIIEQKRGRTGHHINAAKYSSIDFDLPTFIPIPIYPQGFIEGERDRWELMQRQGNRVVLSGLGGDEFLGGVPTPIPELADLVYNLFHPFRKKTVASHQSSVLSKETAANDKVTGDSCLVSGQIGGSSSVSKNEQVSSSFNSKNVGKPSTKDDSSGPLFGVGAAPSSLEGGGFSAHLTSSSKTSGKTSTEEFLPSSKNEGGAPVLSPSVRNCATTEPGRGDQSLVMEGGYPPVFADLQKTKDFKSNDFGTAESEGVMGPFFGSAESKGLAEKGNGKTEIGGDPGTENRNWKLENGKGGPGNVGERGPNREWPWVNKQNGNTELGLRSSYSYITGNSLEAGSGRLGAGTENAQAGNTSTKIEVTAKRSTADVIAKQSSAISGTSVGSPALKTKNSELKTSSSSTASSPISNFPFPFSNFRSALHDLSAALDAWSKAKKMPRLKLLWQAVRASLPERLQSWLDSESNLVSIISTKFEKKAKHLLKVAKRYCYDYEYMPSRISYIRTWEHLINEMEAEPLPLQSCQERTFPYFDRDLLEFLHAIPRTQLIRGGQRRSLMRRALADLVPHEVLWRKNKAIGARFLMRAMEDIVALYRVQPNNSYTIRYNYFDVEHLRQAFNALDHGQLDALRAIRKFSSLELWLGNFRKVRYPNSIAHQELKLTPYEQCAFRTPHKLDLGTEEFLCTETERAVETQLNLKTRKIP